VSGFARAWDEESRDGWAAGGSDDAETGWDGRCASVGMSVGGAAFAAVSGAFFPARARAGTGGLLDGRAVNGVAVGTGRGVQWYAVEEEEEGEEGGVALRAEVVFSGPGEAPVEGLCRVTPTGRASAEYVLAWGRVRGGAQFWWKVVGAEEGVLAEGRFETPQGNAVVARGDAPVCSGEAAASASTLVAFSLYEGCEWLHVVRVGWGAAEGQQRASPRVEVHVVKGATALLSGVRTMDVAGLSHAVTGLAWASDGEGEGRAAEDFAGLPYLFAVVVSSERATRKWAHVASCIVDLRDGGGVLEDGPMVYARADPERLVGVVAAPRGMAGVLVIGVGGVTLYGIRGASAGVDTFLRGGIQSLEQAEAWAVQPPLVSSRGVAACTLPADFSPSGKSPVLLLQDASGALTAVPLDASASAQVKVLSRHLAGFIPPASALVPLPRGRLFVSSCAGDSVLLALSNAGDKWVARAVASPEGQLPVINSAAPVVDCTPFPFLGDGDASQHAVAMLSGVGSGGTLRVGLDTGCALAEAARLRGLGAFTAFSLEDGVLLDLGGGATRLMGFIEPGRLAPVSLPAIVESKGTVAAAGRGPGRAVVVQHDGVSCMSRGGFRDSGTAGGHQAPPSSSWAVDAAWKAPWEHGVSSAACHTSGACVVAGKAEVVALLDGVSVGTCECSSQISCVAVADSGGRAEEILALLGLWTDNVVEVRSYPELTLVRKIAGLHSQARSLALVSGVTLVAGTATGSVSAAVMGGDSTARFGPETAIGRGPVSLSALSGGRLYACCDRDALVHVSSGRLGLTRVHGGWNLQGMTPLPGVLGGDIDASISCCWGTGSGDLVVGSIKFSRELRWRTKRLGETPLRVAYHADTRCLAVTTEHPVTLRHSLRVFHAGSLAEVARMRMQQRHETDCLACLPLQLTGQVANAGNGVAGFQSDLERKGFLVLASHRYAVPSPSTNEEGKELPVPSRVCIGMLSVLDLHREAGEGTKEKYSIRLMGSSDLGPLIGSPDPTAAVCLSLASVLHPTQNMPSDQSTDFPVTSARHPLVALGCNDGVHVLRVLVDDAGIGRLLNASDYTLGMEDAMLDPQAKMDVDEVQRRFQALPDAGLTMSNAVLWEKLCSTRLPQGGMVTGLWSTVENGYSLLMASEFMQSVALYRVAPVEHGQRAVNGEEEVSAESRGLGPVDAREWYLPGSMPTICLEGLGADHQTRYATTGGFLNRGLALAGTREGRVAVFARDPKTEGASIRARRRVAMRLRERGQPRDVAETGAAGKVPLVQLEEVLEGGLDGAVTAGCRVSLGIGPERATGILLASHTGSVALVTLEAQGNSPKEGAVVLRAPSGASAASGHEQDAVPSEIP